MKVYTIEECIPYEGQLSIYSTLCKETADKMVERLNTLAHNDNYYYTSTVHDTSNNVPQFVMHDKLLFSFDISDENNIKCDYDLNFDDFSKVPLEGKFEQFYDPFTGEDDPDLHAYVWADSREEAEKIAIAKFLEMKNNGELK